MKKGKYVEDGITYNSYEDYCNSKNLDPDIVGVMLATGRRTPQNDYERRLLEEIQEMQRKGIAVEFPFN